MYSIQSTYSSDDLSTIPNTPTTSDFMSLKAPDNGTRRIHLLEQQIKKLNQREQQLRLKMKKRICRHDQGETIWQGPHWTGRELPLLFGMVTRASSPLNDTTLPQLILSLKASLSQFEQTEKSSAAPFFTEVQAVLDSIYTGSHCTFAVDYDLVQRRDRERLHRLLNALDKSLERNRQFEKETELLIQRYKSSSTSQIQELSQLKKQLAEQKRLAEIEEHQNRESLLNTSTSNNSSRFSENQLELALVTCQKERDLFEVKVESMQRQIDVLTEELEETRQQRTRFKSQANRLRVGLEAIQRKNQNSDDEEEEERSDGSDSLRLMYNEAERRATDLDRESKRQILAMNSLRQELKSIHEKYDGLVIESKEKINLLENEVNKLKQTSTQQQQTERKTLIQSSSTAAIASISKIELEAAQAEVYSYKCRAQQLERQCRSSLELKDILKEIQLIFQNELEQEKIYVRTLAKQIQEERTIWEENLYKEFQKRYDIDRIQVTREIRTLSFKLTELEEEIVRQRLQHQHELNLTKSEMISESEKRLLKTKGLCRKKEIELIRQNEMLSLKNQTINEELVAVYCKNIMFAEQLGKLK